jgi:hypothetical protein
MGSGGEYVSEVTYRRKNVDLQLLDLKEVYTVTIKTV